MNRKTKNYLKEYMQISDELKHMTNSLMRLQLLFSLYESDKTMKEINELTKLSYSAISTNIRILEVDGYVLREGNHYILSNVMRLYLKNLMEFDQTINVLKEFFNIFENHKVRNIPTTSISELYLVEDSKLIESCGTDIYKINEIIVDTLNKANEIRIVLPVTFHQLSHALEKFIKKGKKAELKISQDIFEDFIQYINFEGDNVKLKEFKNSFNILLIITGNTMIFGLYKKDGTFDQNRILISKSNESLKWANRLFNVI